MVQSSAQRKYPSQQEAARMAAERKAARMAVVRPADVTQSEFIERGMAAKVAAGECVVTVKNLAGQPIPVVDVREKDPGKRWTLVLGDGTEKEAHWYPMPVAWKEAGAAQMAITYLKVNLKDLAVGDVLDHSSQNDLRYETIRRIEPDFFGQRLTWLEDQHGDERQLVLKNVGLHKVISGDKLLAARADQTKVWINGAGHPVWKGE